MKRVLAILALTSAATGVHAQTVVSLRAGLVTYAEGRILNGDLTPLAPRNSVHIQTGQRLVTRRGRAELLLGPAVFLRTSEESTVTMENDRLTEVCVRLERGSAIIDAVEVIKGNVVHVRMGDALAEIRQPGMYRFEAGTNEIRVYEGKLEVVREGSASLTLKKGRALALTPDAKPQSFERDQVDRLQRWSARRSLAVAQSNMVSARTAHGWGWKRFARSWIYSIYSNSEAARSKPVEQQRPAVSGF